MDRVLLTGVTGYVGQHCAAVLLNQGNEVVGTLRSRAKGETTRAALARVAPVDKLTFVEADLLSDKGWDAAMQGCRFALHVASPFVLAEPKDEDDLIRPAVEGTRRVIAAAQRAGVERLVLTSSTVAISSGRGSGRYGPESWSDTDAPIGAYAKSKTLAERAAWDAVKGGPMELVVIAPGAVFGPSLGAQLEGQSVALMKAMIGGKMPMIPDLGMGMIDVRDVARLHVAAMTAEAVAGQRFITSSAEPVTMATMARILRQSGHAKVPRHRAPSLLLRMMALFDRDVRGMLPYLGKVVAYDTSATVAQLGWIPTPMETSFRDMAAALSQAQGPGAR